MNTQSILMKVDIDSLLIENEINIRTCLKKIMLIKPLCFNGWKSLDDPEISFQYIYRHRTARHISSDGTTAFEDIAKECRLDLSDLRRFLRVAIARHVFKETEIGSIAHTAASRLLVDNPMVEAWILNIAEEFWPSLARMVDATAKWPGSQEPNESGYSLSHNTNENPFDVIKQDPNRQKQFVTAMDYSHLHPSYGVKYLVDNFDCASIGAGTIVDVGGSHGQVSIEIARRFPDVKCIVQDLPDTIAGLENRVPENLKSSISGMEHDFLTPQTVKDADIYLFRWILHDWSDIFCVKILQNLTPALMKGAKILINDICVPQPGQLGVAADRSLRLMDISMTAFNNAWERDFETWASLFAQADPRFEFKGITIPPEARMAIILAEWRGD